MVSDTVSGPSHLERPTWPPLRTCNACGWPSTETRRQRRRDGEREWEREGKRKTRREREKERRRVAHGVEGQNPLVVSLGIPPCGGDRGMVRRGGRERHPFRGYPSTPPEVSLWSWWGRWGCCRHDDRTANTVGTKHRGARRWHWSLRARGPSRWCCHGCRRGEYERALSPPLPPLPPARTLACERGEREERARRAVLSYRTHYGLRIRTEACVQVWTYGAYARPSSEAWMIPRRENAIFQRRADVATRARDAKISLRILAGRRVISPLQFVGNIVFKYLNLVEELWQICLF